MKNELSIDDAPLTYLDDTYLELPDGHKKYMSVYYGTSPVPKNFSHTDIESLVTFSQAELNDAIQSKKDQFALTFLAIWQKYERDLIVT